MAHFDRAIPPGGEGTVTLNLNLANTQGKLQKTAEVLSNDPKKPRVTLKMLGFVKAFIEVSPSNMVVFQGMGDQTGEETVDVVSTLAPFHIQNVETNLGDQVEYKVETVEDGKRYKIVFTNKVKKGDYHGYVKLLTDHPKKPEVSIRVTGNIMGEVSVKPLSLSIGKLDLNAAQPPRTGVVVVLNNRNTPFRITKLTYDEQYLAVVQKPIPDKQGFSLEITPRLEQIPKGGRQQASLVVETDVNPEEKHTVQVFVVNK